MSLTEVQMPKATKTAAPKRTLKLVKTAPKKAAPKKTAAKAGPKKTMKTMGKKTMGTVTPMKKGTKTIGVKKKPQTQKAFAGGGTNPFWKFLEMKEARRKQMAEEQHGHTQYKNGGGDGKMHSQHTKYSKFAGPRRRAS
jgi:hypothetical protein